MRAGSAPGAPGSPKPRVIAIVPAAGSGKRLGIAVRKPFVLLKGKPIIAHTLGALEECGAIDEIVVASEKSCIKKFRDLVKKYRFSKVSGIIVGGDTRYESVKNCLKIIGSSFDIVIVHDGARPFVDSPTVSESVRLARKFGACVVGAQMTDTVKLVDDRAFIKKTLDRSRLFRAETPQAFRYNVIKRAYGLKRRHKVTDDSGLAELLGLPVKVLIGSRHNMKITTREDIKIAEALL
jgi:2-C-methyl-D-erythritol 4-phosphate cytidylyltransferase